MYFSNTATSSSSSTRCNLPVKHNLPPFVLVELWAQLEGLLAVRRVQCRSERLLRVAFGLVSSTGNRPLLTIEERDRSCDTGMRLAQSFEIIRMLVQLCESHVACLSRACLHIGLAHRPLGSQLDALFEHAAHGHQTCPLLLPVRLRLIVSTGLDGINKLFELSLISALVLHRIAILADSLDTRLLQLLAVELMSLVREIRIGSRLTSYYRCSRLGLANCLEIVVVLLLVRVLLLRIRSHLGDATLQHRHLLFATARDGMVACEAEAVVIPRSECEILVILLEGTGLLLSALRCLQVLLLCLMKLLVLELLGHAIEPLLVLRVSGGLVLTSQPFGRFNSSESLVHLSLCAVVCLLDSWLQSLFDLAHHLLQGLSELATDPWGSLGCDSLCDAPNLCLLAAQQGREVVHDRHCA